RGVVCSFPAILSCFFGLPPIVSLARRIATSQRRKAAGLVCPCPRCGGSCDMRAALKNAKAQLARPLHRRMSFADFKRIPRQPGWKHEYYGGKAHITPSHTMVSLLLDLGPRESVNHPGIRPVTEADADALLQPFLDAFRQTPEYVEYSAELFKKSAVKYIAGFFGNVRGHWSPASVVMENKNRIIAAALIKRGQTLPRLDSLFVCPCQGRT